MSKRKRRPPALPFMVAEMMLSSYETIARRTWMMALGTCSAAEYQRMVNEKILAAYSSYFGLANKRSANAAMLAALSPWHRRATANAKRLRRK